MSKDNDPFAFASLPSRDPDAPSSTAVTPSKPVVPVSAVVAVSAHRRAAQPVTGVTPPSLAEALIRETWPSVAHAGIANLAAKCMCSIVLAPLGWLLLAPLFAMKFSPFIARRYTLTNRRLMIQTGLKPAPVSEVLLAAIDEVRLGAMNEFFRCGDIEIVSKGQVVLKLASVPEPDSFRVSVLNACAAWVDGKAKAFNHFEAANAKG